ncbi:MAG: hypothetical protein H6659_10580 [Ardenticatenaceae bacterium]|nr:hypothetical protein [Anaerolineales bacterium]MCB8984260.1 hypothetical protein [Ardenticatenaceae bacterium]MCB8987495.1 hypothetical protein [Ardenticatenaceae bacterium]
MAKKSKRKTPKPANDKQDEEIVKAMNEPWIALRSGMTFIVLLGLGFAAFMIWQLYPTEGVWRALMWGAVSAVAIWLVFFLALGFNKLVRR